MMHIANQSKTGGAYAEKTMLLLQNGLAETFDCSEIRVIWEGLHTLCHQQDIHMYMYYELTTTALLAFLLSQSSMCMAVEPREGALTGDTPPPRSGEPGFVSCSSFPHLSTDAPNSAEQSSRLCTVMDPPAIVIWLPW